MNLLHLHLTENNLDSFWNTVKKIRKGVYKSSNACKETMLKVNAVRDLIDEIEKDRNINSTTELYENVTQETLETAGEMFTFLTFCPPETHAFYDDLFKETPKNMILAIISMLKTARNAVKESTKNIALKTFEKLKINNHYRNIEDLNIGNCTLNCNDFLNTLSKIFFIMAHCISNLKISQI